MTLSYLFKRVGITAALALSSTASAQNFALMGGQDYNGMSPPLGFVLTTTGQIIDLNLSTFSSSGYIGGVALNDSGVGLLGGQDNNSPFAVFLSPTGVVTDLDLSSVISQGYINSVANNGPGQGLLGGVNQTSGSVPLAFTVSPTGNLSQPLMFPGSVTGGAINFVAINDSGTGLAGGSDQISAPFGLLLPPSSTTFIDLNLSALVSSGYIHTVAINATGEGLLGGHNSLGNAPPIAFYLTPSMGITLLPLPSSTAGIIQSVAINASGTGLIVGYDTPGAGTPIAFLVTPTQQLIDLQPTLQLPTGFLGSAAINDAGFGIIGGNGVGPRFPVAFLVSPTGVLTNLNLSSIVSTGVIDSVAINEFGVGLLGGEDFSGTSPPIAFLVTPTGGIIQLDLSSFTNFGEIYGGVAIINQIPTARLNGNNLRLANYINKYAPYDAFYFAPAFYDGTLNEALESAAPTRNSFALFTADNNLFFLNTTFSRHSRDSRSFRRQISQETQPIAMEESAPMRDSTELLASIAVPTYCRRPAADPCEVERPYQLWGSVLGALSYQKAEHQSPAFNPTTGAAILAFDAKATTHAWFGGGAAYAYTHIHEKQDAGHSNINQEYLFFMLFGTTPVSISTRPCGADSSRSIMSAISI